MFEAMDGTSRLPRRARRVIISALGMLVAGAVHAQTTHAVTGTTLDSASGLPLAGALVELRSPTDRRTIRSDETGAFRIRALSPGHYQVSVLRIGFAELKRELDLGDRDTVLTLPMRANTQRLNAFRVRGDTSAIYGMVASLPDLLPIKGARVQIIGANASRLTDSTGGFFIPVSHPGSYMVRMSRDGFVDRMFPIDVPRDRAVEASRMLDPGPGTPKAMEGLFADADQRLRYRGMNSAIVTGAELRKIGGILTDALLFAPSLTKQGLRIGAQCLFVNGVKKAHAELNMYDVNEIEAVEVYGPDGDNTGDLKRQCEGSRPPMGALVQRPPVSGNYVMKYVVIWLRK